MRRTNRAVSRSVCLCRRTEGAHELAVLVACSVMSSLYCSVSPFLYEVRRVCSDHPGLSGSCSFLAPSQLRGSPAGRTTVESTTSGHVSDSSARPAKLSRAEGIASACVLAWHSFGGLSRSGSPVVCLARIDLNCFPVVTFQSKDTVLSPVTVQNGAGRSYCSHNVCSVQLLPLQPESS